MSSASLSNLPSPTELAPLVTLYNDGKFSGLAIQINTFLARYSESGFLWKLLGATNLQLNKDALPAFRQAATLLPNEAESHFNLGVAFKKNGEFTQAIDSYRIAITINPNYTEAHANLGNIFRYLGRLDEAIVSLRYALKLNPNSPVEHNNLGTALKDSGQLEQAITSYQHAISINANFLNARYNLGNTLKARGQLDDAIEIYQTILRLKPDFTGLHNSLGLTFQENGQLKEAMDSYQKALATNSSDFKVYNNVGTLYKQAGKFEDAAKNFRRAIALKSDSEKAWGNLGAALKELGEIEESFKCHQRALEIDPTFVEAHDIILYNLNMTERQPPSYCLDEARKYGSMVTSKVKQAFTTWQCSNEPDRLRVGFVSGDLRTHAVGFFLDDLLAQIDPARLELIAYPTYYEVDALTKRVKPYFSAWHSLVGLNDKAAAERIHADGVHILIDLSGHTLWNRLPVFAWKPAPVQVSWLGYFATTGVAEMDYLLADHTSVPESLREQFTESIWYLPDTKQCLTAPKIDLEVVRLPALNSGHVTFGSFQRLDKISDNVLSAWRKILAALPNARLQLTTRLLDNSFSREQFTQRLRQHNFDLDRISMNGAVAERKEYLAQYNEIDIALDTFPYGGTTTTCEALWMGVPTLTFTGETFLSRFAASVVMAAGMPNWIAKNEAEYIEKAIQYANDIEGLAKLRSNLRNQALTSPVFDMPRFTRNFETALWGMWQDRKPQQP